MMQAIRSKSQGVLAWLIVGMIALVFTFWGMEGFLSGRGETVVADIDGQAITQIELDTSYERLARLKQPTNALESDQLKAVSLERLVNMAILSQTTDALGLYISPERVQRTIMTSPDFLIEGTFSRERYQQALRGALLTDKDLQSELQHVLSVEQLQNGIVGSSFAQQKDIDDIVKFIDQKRKLGYAVISHEDFSSQVIIKDEELQDFYDKDTARFILPEQVSVDYVELSLTNIAAQLDFTDEQLEDYYHNHSATFTTDERIRASHILVPVSEESSLSNAEGIMQLIKEKLAAGESFEDLAKQYSQDPISARNGGDLEWFGHGQMIPEFEAVAFALKVGEISDPVQTDYGLHIIKLTGYQAPEKPAFNKVKGQVEAKMRHATAEEKLYDAIESVSVMAFEQPNTLAGIADVLNLTVSTSDYFSLAGGTGILSHPGIVEAAFSDDVKVGGHNSDVVQINDEAFIVLRLRDSQEARQQALEEVADDIRKGLTARYAIELTQGLSRDVLMSIEQGEDPRQVAKFHGLEWVEASEVTRVGSDVDQEIVEHAFIIPRPNKGEMNGVVAPLRSGDYATIMLFDVENGDPALLDSQRAEAFTMGLAQTFGEVDYQLILADSLQGKVIDIK